MNEYELNNLFIWITKRLFLAALTQATQSAPISIPSPKASSKVVAYSPGTVRQNIIANELSESLRKNLLWEHQSKSQVIDAHRKRTRIGGGIGDAHTWI